MDRVRINEFLFIAAIFAICLIVSDFSGLIGSSGIAYTEEAVYAKPAPMDSSHGELIFSYQYLPVLKAYYDSAGEVRFKESDGKWVKSPMLPSTVRNRLGHLVLLPVNAASSHELHSQMKEYYPPKPVEIAEETARSPHSGLSEVWKETYRYQYYPASEVYYDPGNGLFFYNIDGRWEKSRDPPAYFAARPREFTIVEMKTPNPFEFHSQVKQIDQVEIERLSAGLSDSPSWQPVGFDDVYDYRYYPAASVYFDVNRNIYYHQYEGQWIESKSLPEDMANKLGPSAVLHMNSATPYVYHSEVMKRFPPSSERQLERGVYVIWKESVDLPGRIVCYEGSDHSKEASKGTGSPKSRLYCQRSEVQVIEAPMETGQ